MCLWPRVLPYAGGQPTRLQSKRVRRTSSGASNVDPDGASSEQGTAATDEANAANAASKPNNTADSQAEGAGDHAPQTTRARAAAQACAGRKAAETKAKAKDEAKGEAKAKRGKTSRAE